MARKKIVYVIVEGPSDEEALGVILSRLYDSNFVYVHIEHGDITTERGISSFNVLKKIHSKVTSYAKANHFTTKDFQKIIHITDTDGAFIPQGCIKADSSKGTSYDLSFIHTDNLNGIINRNSQKSAVLNKLSSTPNIGGIPYSIFYMSCNLDHVLYDKLNSSDEEKEDDSFKFAQMYKDNLTAFLTFIGHSSFSVATSYRESWDFIKEGINSLQRHTNFGICFQELQKKNDVKD